MINPLSKTRIGSEGAITKTASYCKKNQRIPHCKEYRVYSIKRRPRINAAAQVFNRVNMVAKLTLLNQ